MQELFLVVPLVDGATGIQAFVALQADQVGVEDLGHHLGDLGLTDPGGTFDEEWAEESLGQMDPGSDRAFRDVTAGLEGLLDADDVDVHLTSVASLVSASGSACLYGMPGAADTPGIRYPETIVMR